MLSPSVPDKSPRGLPRTTSVSRVVGCISDSLDVVPIISIADEELSLAVHVDADFGGPAAGDQKSTSGFVIALEGQSSFAMLAWEVRVRR